MSRRIRSLQRVRRLLDQVEPSEPNGALEGDLDLIGAVELEPALEIAPPLEFGVLERLEPLGLLTKLALDDRRRLVAGLVRVGNHQPGQHFFIHVVARGREHQGDGSVAPDMDGFGQAVRLGNGDEAVNSTFA